jgi:hypothetical protein
MVLEWLHMPSENGYNRRRHLSRTPPEFWSRHDKAYAGWERSKYFRALYKGDLTSHPTLGGQKRLRGLEHNQILPTTANVSVG